MFKVGDSVKYVKCGKFDNITLNNVYVVHYTYSDGGDDYISIVDDCGSNIKVMFAWRFELCLRDQRKKKLEKICSK